MFPRQTNRRLWVQIPLVASFLPPLKKLCSQLIGMHVNCVAYGCMECCKRYWITVLPSEANKIAGSLNEKPSDFLHAYCLFQVQLYPTDKKTENPLVISIDHIPLQFHAKIKEKLGSIPPFLLALPTIVFKREPNGACEFLNQKNGLCTIYEHRPGQCELFPFIPSNNKPLHVLYPFCAYLQDKKPNGRFAHYGKTQFKKTEKYFRNVEKKGFETVWKTIPEQGILRLDDHFLGRISKTELVQLLGTT